MEYAWGEISLKGSKSIFVCQKYSVNNLLSCIYESLEGRRYGSASSEEWQVCHTLFVLWYAYKLCWKPFAPGIRKSRSYAPFCLLRNQKQSSFSRYRRYQSSIQSKLFSEVQLVLVLAAISILSQCTWGTCSRWFTNIRRKKGVDAVFAFPPALLFCCRVIKWVFFSWWAPIFVQNNINCLWTCLHSNISF